MSSPASKQLVVEIGGFPISLFTEDEHFWDLSRHSYQDFLSAGPAKFKLQLQILRYRSMSDD